MHFEDKFEVEAPADRVWKFVSNPNEFVKIIPDLQSFESAGPDRFKAAFKVGVGMVRGTVNMSFSFEDLNPPSSVKVVGRGTGLQSAFDLNILIRLTPMSGKTSVSWSADLLMGGLVANVGSRLLQSATETKIRQIVEGIRREVK